MSELEKLLRDILEKAQNAQEMSYDCPNPFSGHPSHLTTATMQIQAWAKFALGESIAYDTDEARGGVKRVATLFTSRSEILPEVESGEDDSSS